MLCNFALKGYWGNGVLGIGTAMLHGYYQGGFDEIPASGFGISHEH